MKKIFPILFILAVAGTAWFLWRPQPEIITLKPAAFKKLPGWDKSNVKKSLETFQVSCKTFLRQDPESNAGSELIPLQVKDWQPACRAAIAINPVTRNAAKKFFQHWFKPIEFYNKQTVKGLFTGYYMPLLHGSLTRTAKYNVPIYGMPRNLVTVNLSDFNNDYGSKRIIGRMEKGKIRPYYTREEINKGAISKHAPVLVWVDNHVDRLFLEIQGSGIIKLTDGKKISVGYAGENGAPYTAIGKVLIDKGVMTKDTASMQAIKAYLTANPQERDPILNQNKSFVFFRMLDNTDALGAQGVPLTAGYSLAVDRKWIPLGAPLWLDTTHPVPLMANAPQKLQRLMIAQDTGGAIRGTVRGDVFWGAGQMATLIAGNMKNEGHYWLLVPREAVAKLPRELKR
ncbi:murein transglycosylase A [Legionella dresdenensis]|uniref:Membrane-bound lytic murein transglycosylase A n=1 Tax=Legionella dresdenensis TaxID=450200 RepID=A0ABV8CGG4_9GAMM